MNSKQRVLAALNLEKPDKVPFMDDIDRGTKVAIMGKEDFTEAEVALKMGLDGVYIMEYGVPVFCDWIISDDGRKYMGEGLIKKDSDLDKMVFPDIKKPGFFDSTKRIIAECDQHGLAAFTDMRWGPSGAFYSMGADGLGFALFDNPKLLETVLDRYAEHNIELMEIYNNIGLDFVITYDNICYNNGPIISPKAFREFFIPREKKVAESCKLPWACHMDGNITKIVDDLLTLGMNALHPIEATNPQTNLKEMKEKYGDRVCLWGNIDINYVLMEGTKEEVEKEVLRCLEEGSPNGGYIIGSSNCLAEYLNMDNVRTMCKVIANNRDY